MRVSARIGTPSAYHGATLIALVGGGLLVYWTSTARPMWVDEQMLALNVRDRTLVGLAGPLWLDQSAPFGWLALERLILASLGTGERAVRLLTVLFGIGTLAAAVCIGRRWMSGLGAAILVALCAFGEWIVFFTLELKHYSADTFGALSVPALAAWALGDKHVLHRRLVTWWLVAAAALWFSNGALFVTPGCAAVLLVRCCRPGLPRSVSPLSSFLAPGLLWFVSFALCYMLVLRHALENTYLKNYWAFAFPPVAEGGRAALGWLLTELGPFATKPVGSGLPALFWAAYGLGMIVAVIRGSALAEMFAVVPLTALALAGLRFIPTFERLALWFVPSLYVGVALCGDQAVSLASLRPSGRFAPAGRDSWPARLGAPFTAAVLGILSLTVCVDVVARGVFALEHRPHSNYGLDDRSSVGWALAAHRSGDVLLSTHYGLTAIWWYGGLNVSDPDRSGRLPDGTPMFEIRHVAPGDQCRHWDAEMDRTLAGRSRIVVYLGFRMNVEPPGFDALVLEELGRRGALVGYKEYAEESRLAVFDLTMPASAAFRATPMSAVGRTGADFVRAPPGCISITPARRW